MQKEKIQKAFENFNTTYDYAIEKEHKKFKNIGTNLEINSKHFLKEALGDSPLKYMKYKRGSIIEVEFGINIGSEFSGNHLAVVINFNDNPSSGSISVLPLSSKSKKSYVSLGKTIIIKVSEQLKILVQNHVDALEKSKKLKLEIDECIQKAENRIKEIDFSSKVYKDEIFESEIKNAEIKSQELKKHIEFWDNSINKLKKILEKYETKNAETFVIPQIYTISKFKIKKPLNKYDPIGNIFIEADDMNRIEEVLKSNYFTK